MKLFGIDSKLYKFMDNLFTILKLNFIWILFSLPIVTIGASTVAAFNVTLKMANNEEGKIFSEFYQSFKLNLKQGIILGLVTLIGVYACYMNFQLFNKIENNPIIFLIAGIIIIFLLLTNLTYAFPLLARYENSLLKTIENAREITYKYFLRSILLWIIVGFLIVLFLFTTILMFIGILIGPATIFLTISGFARKIFTEIEEKNLE